MVGALIDRDAQHLRHYLRYTTSSPSGTQGFGDKASIIGLPAFDGRVGAKSLRLLGGVLV